jgi:hypothetical protein
MFFVMSFVILAVIGVPLRDSITDPDAEFLTPAAFLVPRHGLFSLTPLRICQARFSPNLANSFATRRRIDVFCRQRLEQNRRGSIVRPVCSKVFSQSGL